MSQSAANYRWVATTLEGFVQQLAVGYVARGYFFYVNGNVPKRLSPEDQDQRILKKFDVARSKWSRYRRRKRIGPDGRPLANVQYIRFRNYWVLLASSGHHRFFDVHSSKSLSGVSQINDVRERPIQYGGYSIGHRNGKASIRINRRAYRQLKAHFLNLALATNSTTLLEHEFLYSPFEPYGGVTRQMFAILRAVNRLRKTAAYPMVSKKCIRVRRKAVRPFDEQFEKLAA